MLEAVGIHAGYGDGIVLEDVSLAVPRGEIVALFGRNGVGKTTLLRSVLNLGPKVAEGSIRLEGKPVTGMAPELLARRGVCYMPEGGGVFGELTVEENVRVAVANMPRRDRVARVHAALAGFPMLSTRLRQVAGSLSGGERRMLSLARAIAAQPRYVLLDEPTEGLHVSVLDSVIEAIRGLRDSSKMGVVWVDRALDVALELSDRFAVMENGSITLEGRATATARGDVEAKLVL